MTAQPVTALLLAANPVGTSRLQLDEELREILVKVRASEHRDAIRFVPWFAARPDDLVQTLLQYRPEIVHFSGHGSAAGELILTGDDGAARPVPAEALRRIFRVLRDNVRVVLLNACWSATQAEAIAESVDFTIGMERPIGDQAAITFAASFYRALGFGRSVREAFDLGTTAVLLAGIPEDTTPKLITRPGAPEPAYLMTPAGPDRPTLILSVLTKEGRREPVRYRSRTVDGRVVIAPEAPYLDRVRDGGELGPANPYWGYPFELPALDVKLVNNTGQTVVLHEAVLRVAGSRRDPRPVPMFHEALGMYLPFWDDGWGRMSDLVLRFRLGRPGGDPVGPPAELRFDDVVQPDLSRFFAAAGVDVDLFRRLAAGRLDRDRNWVHLPAGAGVGEPVPPGEPIPPSEPIPPGEPVLRDADERRMRPDAFDRLRTRALGPFPDGRAVLIGDISYRAQDRDGAPVEMRNPLRVEFDLLGQVRYTGGLGWSEEYQAVLRREGRGYEVPVPISQSLAPGEADRFLIRVAAECSSLHDLTLTLRYNDDQELTSRPVALDLFVPRTQADHSLSSERIRPGD